MEGSLDKGKIKSRGMQKSIKQWYPQPENRHDLEHGIQQEHQQKNEDGMHKALINPPFLCLLSSIKEGSGRLSVGRMYVFLSLVNELQ